MESFEVRPMQPAERLEVAELICVSTNVWYQTHGRSRIFPSPDAAEVFCDVYETLDPGCCLVAAHGRTGRLAGSCFYHPRPTHVSLGIMNVHPNYFGRGIARRLLATILDIADAQHKPTRLVSSAMNLDSFSLYTRAGFVPQTPYQDMYVSVPAEGLPFQHDHDRFVREATLSDLADIVALEMEVAGIRRDGDFRYFLENAPGFWHVSVYRDDAGTMQGFMASSAHPGCNMIGPGAARTPEQAAALVLAELQRHRGRTPVFLVPVQCGPLVAAMYRWGAVNCETHFSQIRGHAQPLRGIHMPTFLPETS